jgi:5'-nucleotidase
MKHWIQSTLLVLAAAAVIAAPARAEEDPQKITIASTASIKGYLHDCGCKKKQLGGFTKRATLLAEARAEDPDLLLVDVGNWAETEDFAPFEKTRFMFDLMARLGYDFVTLGDRELRHGYEAVSDMLSEHPEIQVVSANITDKDGKPLWPEFTVIERGGARVAITGLTDGKPYGNAVTRNEIEKSEFSFGNVRSTLREVIPKMRRDADVVVVLLQETPAEARRIIDEIPGMDVVIVGNNPGYTFTPDRIANTLLVRGGDQGKYLSLLELYVDGGSIVDYFGEGKPLAKRIEDEPEIKSIIDAWETDWKARKEQTESE